MENYKLITKTEAIELLGINSQQFNKLSIKPIKEARNPYYSNKPIKLYFASEIEELKKSPQVELFKSRRRNVKKSVLISEQEAFEFMNEINYFPFDDYADANIAVQLRKKFLKRYSCYTTEFFIYRRYHPLIDCPLCYNNTIDHIHYVCPKCHNDGYLFRKLSYVDFIVITLSYNNKKYIFFDPYYGRPIKNVFITTQRPEKPNESTITISEKKQYITALIKFLRYEQPEVYKKEKAEQSKLAKGLLLQLKSENLISESDI